MIDFQSDILIWGAAYSGNAVDTNAVLAETGEIAWDQDGAYLDSIELWYDGQPEATPYYWALPAVTQMLLDHPEILEERLAARYSSQRSVGSVSAP